MMDNILDYYSQRTVHAPCTRIIRSLLKMHTAGQVPEAHTCNPNYSGGRDWEDHGSKPAQANTLPAQASEKKGWWSGSSGRVPASQVWGPEFKLQYSQKNCWLLEGGCIQTNRVRVSPGQGLWMCIQATLLPQASQARVWEPWLWCILLPLMFFRADLWNDNSLFKKIKLWS
jgi:hypothetical protein